MPSSVIKALAILLLLFLPGAVIVAGALSRKKISCLEGRAEFFFLALLFSSAAASVFGLLLAYLGWFSVPGLCLILAVFCLALLVFLRPSRKERFILLRRGRSSVFPLCLIMALAALLFFRPIEYIFGGWDPGVYVNTAVHLAKTGALIVADPLLRSLTPEEQGLIAHRHKSGFLEKYPGFRLLKPGGATVIPQFYHLFPVWLAALYDLGGLRGMFFLSPALGLLSLLAIYLSGRELWGKRAALFAVLLLSLNIAEIWQARFPTSEMLAQFFLFAGVFAFARYLRMEERFWAGTAGMAFGLFLLCQISAALIFLPLVVFFYCRWFRSFRKSDLAFWGPLLLLFLLSLLHHLLYGTVYASSIMPRWLIWRPSLAAIPFALALGAIALRALPLQAREPLLRWSERRVPRIALVVLAGLLLWFGYFIRPYLGAASPDRANLVELGWLVTPLGLLVGSLGLLREIKENRKAAVWFFILLVVSFAGVFVWRQLVHQRYMWAARRFAVVAVPGTLLFASRLLSDSLRSRFRVVRRLVPPIMILLVFSTAWGSRIIWRHREYGGAVSYCEKIAGEVAGADLVAVEGDHVVDKLPTVLALIYGHRVLPLYHENGVLMQARIENVSTGQIEDAHYLEQDPDLLRLLGDLVKTRVGKDAVVYLLTNHPQSPPVIPGLDFEAEGAFPYHSGLLERRDDRLPRIIDADAPDGNFTVRIYRISLQPLAPTRDISAP